jgi:CRISPR/Cas system-associated exonuclease Cas4 (RecB family)
LIILSYTSKSLYDGCPKAFKLKYVEKRKPSIRQNVRWFIEGSAVHKTLEKCFKASPTLVEEMAVKEYPSVFDMVISEQRRQGDIHLYRGETIEDIKNNGLNILKQGIKAIKARQMDEGLYKNEFSIGTYVKPFELLPGLFIQGSVDWLKEVEDHILLADFKSSKGTEYLSPAQIIMYVLAVEKIFKKPVKKGFYLMLRTGTIVNVNITPERKELMLIDLEDVNNKIKNNIFVPKASVKTCGECVFRNDCSDSKAKEVGTGEITFGEL